MAVIELLNPLMRPQKYNKNTSKCIIKDVFFANSVTFLKYVATYSIQYISRTHGTPCMMKLLVCNSP